MAAATVQSLTVTSPLEPQFRGNKASYRATYSVVFNQAINGASAIVTARGSGLPQYGSTLNWTDDTDSADNWPDTSVRALDFSAKPIMRPVESAQWAIEVGWRVPDPGQDEDPNFIDQPPLSRPVRHWLEFHQRQQTINTGYLWTEDLPGNPDSLPHSGFNGETPIQKRVMHNSAGEPFEPLDIEELVIVLVAQRNVESPLEALERNTTFRRTCNANEYTVTITTGEKTFEWTIPAYQSRFLRSETGMPVYETVGSNNHVFHRMQTRIEVSSSPYLVTRLNEGAHALLFPSSDFDQEISDDLRQPHRLKDGTINRGLAPLNKDGTPATLPEDFNSIEYMILDPKSYQPFVE